MDDRRIKPADRVPAEAPEGVAARRPSPRRWAAKPVEGPVDLAEMHRDIMLRFPKIRARLGE